MNYQIYPEKCIACGLCQVLAPDIFDYTDAGIVLFAKDPDALEMCVTIELESQALTAYRECPVRAIGRQK